MPANGDSRSPERPAAGSLGRLLRRLAGAHGRQSCAALALSCLAAGTEGVGLLVLIPLLALLGVTGGGTGHGLWSELARFHGASNLYAVLSIFLGVLGLRQLIVYCRSICIMRLRLAFATRLRVELFRALAGAEWECLSARALHRQTQTLMLGSHRAGDAALHAFGIAAAVLVTAVQIGVAIMLSPGFTLLVLLCLTLVGAMLSRRLGDIAALGRDLLAQGDAIVALTKDFVPMLRTAKLSGAMPALVARFQSANERANDSIRRYVMHNSASSVGIQLAAGVVLTVCLVLSLKVFSLGPIQISLLVVVFGRLTPLVAQTHQLTQNLVHELPWVDSALDDIATWNARAEAAELAGSIAAPRHSIALEGVFGGYAAERPVLHAVSLSLPVGKTTLLRGPTGAGKSTLADVLAGLLRPDAGGVLLDGRRLQRRELPAWRRRVGYVDQSATLFAGTIEENLMWGIEDVDPDWLAQVLRLTGVADFLDALPAGLASPVGERGAALSGGQRQRVAIARELLRKPCLLILDEATSGLDAATEARLLEQLRRFDARPLTRLLISHRDTALDYADAVVTLEAGRVAGASSIPVRGARIIDGSVIAAGRRERPATSSSDAGGSESSVGDAAGAVG